jgi:Domain of unknown function (DUF4157)
MSNRSPATITTKEKSSMPMRSSLIQRQCACGNSAGMAGECSDCQKKSLVQRESINQDNTSEVPPIAHEFPIQTKLTVGKPGDIYEQEADRVAAQVMSMGNSTPSIQPARAMGKKEVQTNRSSDGESQAGSNIESRLSSSKGGGSPLPDDVRSFMEPRFEADFGQVRVHTGSEAVQMNRELGAQAFTHKSDIYYGSGKTPAKNNLTAHELTHVMQQGTAGNGTAEVGETSRISEPGQIQRKPNGSKNSPKTKDCPPMERNEREEAAKAQLRLVERIPHQEWLIYGFPIGGSEISGAEAGKFISNILSSLMQGHFIYLTGQDPLEVLGFSDCFAGQQVDNHALRQLRAAKFCAGVKDHYASTPKSYTNLIYSCKPAQADQYIGSNTMRADRAQNRSILIRRTAAADVQFQEGNQSLPYNPKFGPSEAHCAAYSTPLAHDILGRVYTDNAHCSCLVTPDEPHNNCVRNCLQDKMWNLLANASSGRKPNDPPMDINIACPLIWKHHRDCYHDCGCASEFINYLAFDAVCNIALPCAVDSAAINLLNRCMPATENDKYLPVN